MSGGANKQFLSNVSNFLANNILVVNISNNANSKKFMVPQNGGNCGHLITVNISKSKYDKGTIDGGRTCPVYQVDEETGKIGKYSHAFSAYYLPYANNNFATMTLGNAADFFFTDTMNGCSFGRDNTQNPTVAHLNYTKGKVEGAEIDQSQIDSKFDSLFGQGNGRRFKKSDYKKGVADYVTLVGVRMNGQWQFLWQRREWNGAGLPPSGKAWLLHKNMPTTV